MSRKRRIEKTQEVALDELVAASLVELGNEDLELLRTLDAVLQEQDLRAAADHLGVVAALLNTRLVLLRERLGEPILLDGPGGLVLGERAREWKGLVRALTAAASRALDQGQASAPGGCARSLSMIASEAATLFLGPELERIMAEEGREIILRVLPFRANYAELVREGSVELALCPLAQVPEDTHAQVLYQDRFVGIAARRNRRFGALLSLEDYLRLDHIELSPLDPPSPIDAALAAMGRGRRVRRVLPSLSQAMILTTQSELILTASARAALAMQGSMPIRVVELPEILASHYVGLVWSPERDKDPLNCWIRKTLSRAVRAR